MILLYWGGGTDYTKFLTLNCIHCLYMAKLEFEASLYIQYSKDQCLLSLLESHSCHDRTSHGHENQQGATPWFLHHWQAWFCTNFMMIQVRFAIPIISCPQLLSYSDQKVSVCSKLSIKGSLLRLQTVFLWLALTFLDIRIFLCLIEVHFTTSWFHRRQGRDHRLGVT